jgi:hypothetical protein
MLVLLLVVVALVRDQGGWDLEHLRGEAAEVEARAGRLRAHGVLHAGRGGPLLCHTFLIVLNNAKAREYDSLFWTRSLQNVPDRLKVNLCFDFLQLTFFSSWDQSLPLFHPVISLDLSLRSPPSCIV